LFEPRHAIEAEEHRIFEEPLATRDRLQPHRLPRLP